MNRQQEWEAVSALFHRAAELPKPERRWNLEKDGTDPELVEKVLALLDRDDEPMPFMDDGIGWAAARLLDEESDAAYAEEAFGPYRIERTLGAGGMGTVFLGRRADINKVAAIKMLRDAWLSPARRERFLLEQQTLSQLMHPAIAQLYDAGVTRQGTPWFAMEFVDGLPISQYSKEQNLSVEERLRLFQEVCAGVRYAHERAVIHRDLKPANILVTAEGKPKLLDFGIAKTINEATEETQTGLRMMTPAFAAPEQVNGEPVGAFTDVYALGKILRMLLTGASPEEALTSAVVPSDLDLLCRKAQDRDPKRRYQSAEALDRDVGHFLRHEPLDAKPDSWSYRAAKFLRRNARSLATASLAAVTAIAMVVFFVVRLAQARDQAVAQAARSDRIKNLMSHLFQSGTLAGPSTELSATDLLDRGVSEANRLNREPKTQAELYQTLAESFIDLGKFDRADPLLTSALGIRKAEFGAKSVPVAETMASLGSLRSEQSKFPEARELLEEGLRVDQQLLPANDAALARDYFYLGRMLVRSGNAREGIANLNQAVDVFTRTVDGLEGLSRSLDALGTAEFNLGDLAKAEATYQRCLTVSRKVYAPSNPLIAEELVNIGSVRFQQGNLREAERYYRLGLASVQRWYGDDNPYYASISSFLAQVLMKDGRSAEAKQMLEKSLATHERVYGKMNVYVALDCNALGLVNENLKDWSDAERYLKRVAKIDDALSKSGGSQRQFLVSRQNLANLYCKRGRVAEAEQQSRIALAQVTATLPPEHLYCGMVRFGLGKILMAKKKFEEALPFLEQGCSILAKQGNPKLPTLLEAQKELAADYRALGRNEDAKKLMASVTN